MPGLPRRPFVAVALLALAATGVTLGVALTRSDGPAPTAGATTVHPPADTADGADGPGPATGETTATGTDGLELPDAGAQRRALDRFASLGFPVYCGGGRAGKIVALTFDDGPGAYTETALKILRRAGARATFFLVGENLASRPRVPRHEEALGALGNHSFSHPVLPELPRADMESELERTQRAIERLARDPVRLFRPPYGARSPAVDARARELGLVTVLWTIDTRDSIDADHAAIHRHVREGLRPGAIVLMHENRGQTLRALRFRILPELERSGYRTVSIPELLALDPPTRQQLRRGLAGCA